jgi:hypothetical protein
MSSLYHVNQGVFEPGDVIAPGNWGRLVLGFGLRDHGNNAINFLFEYLFQRIRDAEFADKPSRLRSAFAYESFALAEEKARPMQQVVYLVEAADPQSRIHRADVSWFDVLYEYRTFEGVEGVARQYWQGVERLPDHWEVVIEGGVIVKDRLTRFPENGHA